MEPSVSDKLSIITPSNDPCVGQGAADSSPSNQADELLTKEAEKIAVFVKIVNEVIRSNGNLNPMSERTALKFLIARKFDLKRALELYRMHEIIRLREGLTSIDITDDDFKSEIESSKFTILKTKDQNGATIAVFTGKLHSPEKSTRNQAVKDNIHRTSLKGIVYQLDSALEDLSTQLNGIVFIYNMNDSDFSNFDLELCEKILNLLKGAYPAKLKKVLVVGSPFWFRLSFQFLSHIVRKKLRERVKLLNLHQLKEEIPPSSLPIEFGGTYEHDHFDWLHECELLYQTRHHNDLCDPTFAQTFAKDNESGNSKTVFPSGLVSTNLVDLDNYKSELGSSIGGSSVQSRRESGDQSCTYDYDEGGLELTEWYQHIKQLGKQGIWDEYKSIVNNERMGTFVVSNSPVNACKNRYFNIKCYDHTRIILEPYDLVKPTTNGDPMDYINANYVDGYRQPRAYISTQGPTETTIGDFWRMIWQTESRNIVMVTLNVENFVLKCDRYWPSEDHRVFKLGVYKLEFVASEEAEDYIVTHIRLTNTRANVSRDIWHHQFTSWPDFGIPSTGSALLQFRNKILENQAVAVASSTRYPPITVHCSAGVGRSGTFITIDICIQKLDFSGSVNVETVVEKLREQRYSSIQTREQYQFCYKSVYEYAVDKGLLVSEESLDDEVFGETD